MRYILTLVFLVFVLLTVCFRLTITIDISKELLVHPHETTSTTEKMCYRTKTLEANLSKNSYKIIKVYLLTKHLVKTMQQ